jgi:hypothetical protein
MLFRYIQRELFLRSWRLQDDAYVLSMRGSLFIFLLAAYV